MSRTAAHACSALTASGISLRMDAMLILPSRTTPEGLVCESAGWPLQRAPRSARRRRARPLSRRHRSSPDRSGQLEVLVALGRDRVARPALAPGPSGLRYGTNARGLPAMLALMRQDSTSPGHHCRVDDLADVGTCDVEPTMCPKTARLRGGPVRSFRPCES